METSARKPTWGSVRTRRIAKEVPAPSCVAETPVRRPIQQSQLSLNKRSFGHASMKQKKKETRDDGDWSLSSPTRGNWNSDTIENKKLSFKGFHNAFTDTEPMVTNPARRKGANISENPGSDPFYKPDDGDEAADPDMFRAEIGGTMGVRGEEQAHEIVGVANGQLMDVNDKNKSAVPFRTEEDLDAFEESLDIQEEV